MKIQKSPISGIEKTIAVTETERYHICNWAKVAMNSCEEDNDMGAVAVEIGVAREKFIRAYDNGNVTLDKFYWQMLRSPLVFQRNRAMETCTKSKRAFYDKRAIVLTGIINKIDN